MTSRILLIEDEPGLVMTLSDLLSGEGYEVDTASDGPSGLRKALEGEYGAILLDVMLPGMTGFEVCRELREKGNGTAVLMLTARSEVSDRVGGLKLGADDYLTKPFEPAELLARIEALLRRVSKDKGVPVSKHQFGRIHVDLDAAEVMKDDAPVTLAAKEYQLLRYLLEHADQVLSRDELLQNVWEYQSFVSSRTVDVHMAWLRQKLEENPQSPKHFLTIRGTGYRFKSA